MNRIWAKRQRPDRGLPEPARLRRRLLRRTRDEDGVAIVEFAIIAPFLIVLIVGMMDFGFLFNDVISVRQSVRDGVRNAAVGKFGSDTSCTATNGVSGSAKALVCMVKARDDVPDTGTAVAIAVGESGCSGTACYAIGKPIAICQQYRFRAITGLTTALIGKYVTTRTVLRIEITKTGGLSDAAELDLQTGAPLNCPKPAAVT